MLRPVIYYFCLFFLCAWTCFSCGNQQAIQIIPPVQDVDTLLKHADILRKSAATDAALNAYAQALPLLKNGNDLTRWLTTQRRMSLLIGNVQQKRVAAIDLLKAARDTLAGWRMPETYDENYQLALLYMREARVYLEIGDNLQQKESLERTENIFRKYLYGKAHDVAWYFFSEMANTDVRLGEFENAAHLFQESLMYEKTYQQKDIASYNDYGSAYLSQGKYQSAVSIFEQGIQAPFVDTFTQTMLLLNLAEGLLGIKEVSKAQVANEQVPLFLKNDGAYTAIQMARCQRGYLENKAIIAEKMNRWNEAAGYYRNATSAQLGANMQRREKAGFIAAEANTYFQRQQYDSALVRYHEAYLQFYPASKERITDIPDPNDLLTDKILADILDGKAHCFARLNQYDLALRLYELIPVVESQLRATHTFESSSLIALEKSRKRFDQAVELAWKAWQSTHQEKYADKAFLFTEMARGVLQSKGIRANDAYSTLNEAQKVADKSFLTQIAVAETALAEIENNDDPRVNTIMQTIRDLKKDQKSFRAVIMKTNPAYAAEMSSERTCAIGEISHCLLEGQTLFDYYLVDSMALHVFVADKRGNVSWRRIDWTATQQFALDNLILYLGKQDEGNDHIGYFTQTAYALYQLLLAPEINGKTENNPGLCLGTVCPKIDSALLIIPDMELAGLSYEALVTDTTVSDKKWDKLAYLVKKYSVGYAYSASLLQLQQNITRKRAGAARLPYAGFAPAYTDAALRLDSAETDALFAQRLFGGETYLTSIASEEQFRKIAEDAQILLLSMHGVSNHEEPALSKLYFGDLLADQPSDKNNVLTAGELQNIPCRADLAVLSACHTGDGPMEKGEGVYSLARAFTISGVPSTVMSFWLLPTYSSSNMVRDFLTGINGQQHKDVALRTAKLKWLQDNKSSRYAHPYFWAGFVTAGDMSPLRTSRKNNYCTWIAAFTIFIGLCCSWNFRNNT